MHLPAPTSKHGQNSPCNTLRCAVLAYNTFASTTRRAPMRVFIWHASHLAKEHKKSPLPPDLGQWVVLWANLHSWRMTCSVWTIYVWAFPKFDLGDSSHVARSIWLCVKIVGNLHGKREAILTQHGWHDPGSGPARYHFLQHPPGCSPMRTRAATIFLGNLPMFFGYSTPSNSLQAWMRVEPGLVQALELLSSLNQRFFLLHSSLFYPINMLAEVRGSGVCAVRAEPDVVAVFYFF